MKVKICGITRLEDALAAVSYGVWALGFNFYSHSSRAITVLAAHKIVQQLPHPVVTVGILCTHQ